MNITHVNGISTPISYNMVSNEKLPIIGEIDNNCKHKPTAYYRFIFRLTIYQLHI